MRAFYVLSVVALLLLKSHVVHAQESHPWTHPDVLKAAINIQLSQQQRPQFRQLVTNFLQNYGADVRKLLNANNVSGLVGKIAQTRHMRVEEMDQQMQQLLAENQLPAYTVYRDLLLQKMHEQAAARRARD